MRSKNAIRNVMFSLMSAIVSLALTLVNRKVLLEYLGTEMLGYESLFTNVFSILSLSEMGASVVIAYQLYKSVSDNDIQETNTLVSMYKYLYRFIGGIVAILGIILFFFLDRIVTGQTASWDFIQKIYLIQLVATVASYFMTYNRMLYIANQKEFVITKIEMVLNFVAQVLKILVIAVWQSYIAYLIITVGKNVLVNGMVQIKAKKDYVEYVECPVKIEDFTKRGIFRDMYNFLGQKIASILYYNTDNLLISMLLGINIVGLYSNYYTIKTQVFRLTVKLFNPIQATIGNYINSKEKEESLFLFNTLDIISYAFALVFSCCLYNLFQPFITLWYGEEFLLSDVVVGLITLNAYIETLREIPYYFRSAFGQYEVDRKYVAIGAGANIVLTLCLGGIIGLEGVLIGTVIGMLFLWHGVIFFLFKNYFGKNVRLYYRKHYVLGIFSVFFIIVSDYICDKIPITTLGLVARGCICVGISLCGVVIIFQRTREFRQLLNYGRKLLKRRKEI